ncbi:Polycystic kidney disease protein 1-like 2 [Nymphon striatum]|nr:Polycystic kidney disease protein 1-like 2 [Nymphon striatum]
MEQIGVGVMSNLIVFPPSIIIIFLFRKSRPKNLRPSKITEVLNGETYYDDSTDNEEDDDNVSGDNGGKDDNDGDNGGGGGEGGGGSIKSTVILVSLLLSLVCKKTDYDEDDAYEDEEGPQLHFDEEWLHDSKTKSKPKKKNKYLDTDRDEIRRNRIEREKEVKMIEVLREILAYVIFLCLLLVISYGNRDPNSRLLQQAITNGFLKPTDIILDFRKCPPKHDIICKCYLILNFQVKNTERFYRWLMEVFISELMVTHWYNSGPPNGLGGYVDDRANFLVGMPIMRQVRVKES